LNEHYHDCVLRPCSSLPLQPRIPRAREYPCSAPSPHNETHRLTVPLLCQYFNPLRICCAPVTILMYLAMCDSRFSPHTSADSFFLEASPSIFARVEGIHLGSPPRPALPVLCLQLCGTCCIHDPARRETRSSTSYRDLILSDGVLGPHTVCSANQLTDLCSHALGASSSTGDSS
jgi:hypothetical protein